MNPSESVVKAQDPVSRGTTPENILPGASFASGQTSQAQSEQPQEVQPQSPAMAAMPQLPPIASDQPAQHTVAASSSSPLVAADDEVIEQEWVNKAKKIVSETKDNPYEQEKEVGKLQAEYIKKRYGKDIKVVGD